MPDKSKPLEVTLIISLLKEFRAQREYETFGAFTMATLKPKIQAAYENGDFITGGTLGALHRDKESPLHTYYYLKHGQTVYDYLCAT